MQTMESMQEQIDDLRQRLEALEKHPPRRREKALPLSDEEEKQAKEQIIPILKKLPPGQSMTAWKVTQQTVLLRKFGTTKTREFLEKYVDLDVLKRKGVGSSAQYKMKTV